MKRNKLEKIKKMLENKPDDIVMVLTKRKVQNDEKGKNILEVGYWADEEYSFFIGEMHVFFKKHNIPLKHN